MFKTKYFISPLSRSRLTPPNPHIYTHSGGNSHWCPCLHFCRQVFIMITFPQQEYIRKFGVIAQCKHAAAQRAGGSVCVRECVCTCVAKESKLGQQPVR